MKKLSLPDITRHLDQLIVTTPDLEGLFENDNETASFVNKLRRLLDLLKESGTAEPGLRALREALLPGAKEDSRRVLFSNFRKTLPKPNRSVYRIKIAQPIHDP
jgi:hypothetical protein